MKLKKGQTVHIGKNIYRDEIPDEIAVELGLLKKKKEKSDK